MHTITNKVKRCSKQPESPRLLHLILIVLNFNKQKKAISASSKEFGLNEYKD